MTPYRIANYLCAELEELSVELALVLTECSGFRFEFQRPQTLEAITSGEVDLAFLCGLPYTLQVDQHDTSLVPVAAPLLNDDRVGADPVYFADVIVPADASVETFEDLRGAVFGYNETLSFSGYVAMKYELWRRRQLNFFGCWVETGTHKASIDALIEGRVQAVAIDSQVLQIEKRLRPELIARTRLISALGPYPMPPVVLSRRLGPKLIQLVQRELLDLHRHFPTMNNLLTRLGIVEFRAVTDAYYDPIRRVSRSLADVSAGS